MREWESGSSERAIVEQFKQVFIDKGIWEFIPVGNNLAFECRFMKYKLKQYCGLEGLKLGHRPMIDLKHILVIANNGSFRGYQRFLGKSGQAANMAQWYYDKNWPMIEGLYHQRDKGLHENILYSKSKTSLCIIQLKSPLDAVVTLAV